MRFIHTADWHLGRLFHTVHLTDDQQYVLGQFVDLVADVRPTAVLIAGDVYDRGVPPTEAVELLNDVLERIVRGLGVPVVLVAGNHDSPSRLGFGSQFLATEGLHIAGRLPGGGALAVPFADDDGVLLVQAAPYADPIDVRATLGEPDIQTHEQAMRAIVARRLNAAAMDERADVLALNNSLRETLAAKGMRFNDVEPAAFRDKLRTAGFYAEWKQKFGDAAWDKLEAAVGKLS